jgi:hypothetical protein
MKRLLCFAFVYVLYFSDTLAQEFSGSFDLVSTQLYQNGNERIDTISYYFSNEKTAILIHGRRNNPGLRMIFNPEDSTITSLFELNGKKGGFILPMDEDHWPGLPQSNRPHNTTPSKKLNYTGKEKVISGFPCKEVLAENDDYSAILWITEAIPLSMTRVLSYQSVGKGKSKKEIELFDRFGIDKLPLDLFLKSKKEMADVKLRLINFNQVIDDEIFSTEGHSLSKVD